MQYETQSHIQIYFWMNIALITQIFSVHVLRVATLVMIVFLPTPSSLLAAVLWKWLCNICSRFWSRYRLLAFYPKLDFALEVKLALPFFITPQEPINMIGNLIYQKFT